MESFALIEAKKVINSDDPMGRAAVRIRAHVEGDVIEFDEALQGGCIDEGFDSLFLLGKRHPIRGIIEGKLGGTESHSKTLHSYLVNEANKRLGGVH